MAEIATMGTNKLRNALRAARSRIAGIREAAEEAAVRTTVLGGNVLGGGVTGFVIGRAERDGKDITIGDSTIKWTLPVNGGLALAGAFLPRVLGDAAANFALGLGGGGVAFESGLWGYRRGLRASTP